MLQKEANMNSHYVPKFILKNFGERISVYDTQSGKLREDVQPHKVYTQSDLYDEETETKLNKKIESQFANLFNNKIIKCDGQVVLNMKELLTVKKYLLINVLRSVDCEEFCRMERAFYDGMKRYWLSFAKEKGLTAEETNLALRKMLPPFVERKIEGETDFQYWMRTLEVILDTDGTPEAIKKHPDATYPAHRWSEIINAGYLAFWDATETRSNFVISDIGMTSENEIGWNGYAVHNKKKIDFLSNLATTEKDPMLINEIVNAMYRTQYFHENFQMFPISAKRMIVLIAPFYKFRYVYRDAYSMPPLCTLTKLTNEELFAPNRNKYVLPQTPPHLKHHPDDQYIYDIKKLNDKEVQYCNALFMDRVLRFLGFSNLSDAVRSIILYKKLNEYPYTPRVDYTDLYKIIEERYGGNLNV